MKKRDLIDGIIFILVFIGFPIIGGIIAEFLASIITMEMIMNVCYIFLIFAIIYIIKN